VHYRMQFPLAGETAHLDLVRHLGMNEAQFVVVGIADRRRAVPRGGARRMDFAVEAKALGNTSQLRPRNSLPPAAS
jgi:phage protein U